MITVDIFMKKTLTGVDEGQIYPKTYIEGQKYKIGLILCKNFKSLDAIEFCDGEEPKQEPKQEPEQGTKKGKNSGKRT